MKKKNVLAIGEVLFDVIGEEYNLGGAPFNVGAHLAKLGYESYILSSVGVDKWGAEIMDQARSIGVHTDFLDHHPSLATGTVQVTFVQNEPEYEIRQPVAWDAIRADMEQVQSIDWSVIAFGSLAQRSEENQVFYNRFFEEVTAEWIYFDCNLRQDFYNVEVIRRSLGICNIAKFNKEEIEKISEMLYHESKNVEEFGRLLAQDFGIELVVCTWGAEGAKAWYQDHLYEAAGVRVKTQNTVGAGDAFSAGFLHSLVSGSDIETALRKGNLLGAYVASHAGAIPEYTENIRSELNT